MITEVDLSGTPCFAPGTKLTGLKKVNFIFGFNGSGKTSITRALANNGTDGNNDTHVYRLFIVECGWRRLGFLR